MIIFYFIIQLLPFQNKCKNFFQRFVFDIHRDTLIHIDVIYIKEKRLPGLFSYGFKRFLNRHIL